MITSTLLNGYAIGGFLLFWILFLIFSQFTVRKLKRNPETQNELGANFISIWHNFNIIYALVLPIRFLRLIGNGPIGGIYANADLIRQHTGVIDKVFAYLIFWIGHLSILLVIMSTFY